LLPRAVRELGPEDYRTDVLRTHLARVYDQLKQFNEAAGMYGVLADRERKKQPRDERSLAGALALFGHALLRAGRPAKAEPVLRECLDIRRKRDPNLWTTFSLQSVLGQTLLDQKKHSDAEPLLVQGYEGLKQRESTIPKEAKVQLTEALQRIVRLYEEWDKKDEAARWRKELEARTPSHQRKKPKHKS